MKKQDIIIKTHLVEILSDVMNNVSTRAKGHTDPRVRVALLEVEQSFRGAIIKLMGELR